MHQGRLPSTRSALTHKFKVGEHEGYITVGFYDDGKPGEVFLKMSKEGSTISGLLDTVSILTSLGLQYGVPLARMVDKLSYLRFEPSGFTGSDMGYAQSVIDYIFRWLGAQFLSKADGYNESAWGDQTEQSATTALKADQSAAPVCKNCGTLTVPSGACHCCPQCGTSSGCS